MTVFSSVCLIILLILISAVVSCAEIALASSRKIKLQMMGKEGDTRALDALKLQEQPGSFITVVQIGLNTVAILAGIVGEASLNPYFTQWFKPLPQADMLGSLTSFVLVTGSFILFADLMPKQFALTNPERVAVWVVRPMMMLIFLFKPVVWIFNGLASAFFKALNISTVRQDKLTYEDIYAVMDAGAQAGVLKQQEHYLIENVFEMQERTVTSAMSTRESIVYFDKNDDAERVMEVMAEKPHSKFLVCNGNLEHVIGYIEAHALLTLFLKEDNVALTDKRILRKALFIPDTLTLFDVLEAFKSSGEDFAVIVNEYALVVGVVTLKDVMNIVMGELVNTEEEAQIMQRSADTWLVDGATPLEDVMRTFGIEEFPHSENYETIAGFMMYSLRKVPKRTDYVIFGNYKFEVVDTEHFKIDQLLVSLHKTDKK
ncbi:MAG: hemolysin family protein [Neisseria sp.]|nr:hemolysin family protein [Neisseria sp.]